VRTAAFVSDVDPGKDAHKYLRLFDLKQSVPRNFGRLVLGE